MTKRKVINGWVASDCKLSELLVWDDLGKIDIGDRSFEKSKAGDWEPARPIKARITIEIVEDEE